MMRISMRLASALPRPMVEHKECPAAWQDEGIQWYAPAGSPRRHDECC